MTAKIAAMLHGVLPVLHTPLNEDVSIDVPTLEREIDWAFETGADGVVVAMVSEILRLGYHGRKELATRVCEAAQRTRLRGDQRRCREHPPRPCDFARHAEASGGECGDGDPAGGDVAAAARRRPSTLPRSRAGFRFRSSYRMRRVMSARRLM